MRIYRSVLAAVGGLCILGVGTAASAGHGAYNSHCDYESVPVQGHHGPVGYEAPAPAVNCAPGVVVHAQPHVVDPMHVSVNQPFGYLKSVNYSGTQSVNVTRLYGRAPMAGVQDSPTGFTDGCHPTTTAYCRDAGLHNPIQPINVQMAAPAPVYAAPAPVMVDTSRQSRTYGSYDFVPGIAHIPTSIVDRSEANRDAVLATGRAVPQTVHRATGQYSGASSYVSAPVAQPVQMVRPPVMQPAPYRAAPMMAAPSMPQSGVAYTAPAADGTYWEKVSGMTAFGDTVATQVICKKAIPMQEVRPVVNVPHAVPTPVYSPCVETVEHHSRYGAGNHGGHVEMSQSHHGAHAPHHGGAHAPHHSAHAPQHHAPQHTGHSRYGNAPVGWTN